MSVAFRRESDEEHLEPKFELPIPPGPNLVTPRGLDLIAARMAALDARLAAAAEADRPAILRDLRYWRTRHATAVLAPEPAPVVVAIGTTVRFALNGTPRTVTIVGHDEADPDAGLIAFTAPLIRAMIGLEVGETADFAGKDDAIEVLKVETA